MQLKETFVIHAPVAKVWQALTDTGVMDHWNTGPAEMDLRVGGQFSLYDGDVHGTNTELVPNQLLRQEWYGGSHPDRKYDVTFTLVPDGEDSTTVTVTHNASEDDIESMRKTWQEYYFGPMKQLLEKQFQDRVRLKLIGKENIVDNVWSFRFEPTKPLHWTAGQYIWVELPHDNPDGEGARRWFTISSAPYENVVQITTRISNSTFKQALNALPVGGELELLEKPDGDFIWHDSALPIVFVAGGIGITVFHSMLKQRAHEGEPLNVTLLYGNRDDHIPFKAEIDEWAAAHPEFTIRYITGTQLSADSLQSLQPNILECLLYISGPEGMVKALGDQFIERGLPPAQLRLDALKNYTQQNY